MKDRERAKLIARVAFSAFCTGAIMAQGLTENGVILKMGLPAWIVLSVLIYLIDHPRIHKTD